MKIELEGSFLNVDGVEYSCVNYKGDFCVTINQLAQISNYNPKTIRLKIKCQKIKVIKLDNSRVLIRVSEVERLLQNGLLVKNVSA